MSDKFECLKELFDKATTNVFKYCSMLRSSMMNKPKMLVNSANGRLMNEQVVLPLGPTHLLSLDASSKS